MVLVRQACVLPVARVEMSVTAAAVRVSRAIARNGVAKAAEAGYGSVSAQRLGVSAVSPSMMAPTFSIISTRGIAASSSASNEFRAPPRIVSQGRGKGAKVGVVWVPSTAGVGGAGAPSRGRAFETTAGAGAGAPPPPQQQQYTPQQQQTAQSAPAYQSQAQPQRQQRPVGSQNQSGSSSASKSSSQSQPGRASPPDGPRVYCDFAVYKSKAAVKFGVIKPQFEPIPGKGDGSVSKKRDGGVLLEFAPAVGQRAYDWQNKQSILLSPLELVELTETLAVLGKGVAFFHDPGMGTARQGAMTKSLKAEPMPDGSGGVFLNLATNTGAKLNVAVSFGEFCVLRNLTQYLVPRLMGFDEVFK